MQRTISQEEIMVEGWLKEAVEAGLVIAYACQPKSFELIAKKTVNVTVQMKTKTKVVAKHMCNAHTYTADFYAVLSNKGREMLCDAFPRASLIPNWGVGILYIDAKGTHTIQHGQVQMFSCNQKLVFDLFGTWVEKVVPWNTKGKCLFKSTWCPESYRWKNGRKVPTLTTKGEACRTVQEFIAMKGGGE